MSCDNCVKKGNKENVPYFNFSKNLDYLAMSAIANSSNAFQAAVFKKNFSVLLTTGAVHPF
jgi:hypothetical protein